MEISPVAITHCCVQCDDNISISMRVIEINKIQKRVNTDNGKSWKKMTSCEQKAVIQFQHNVIWKFEDNLWDQAVVSVLINKHEYMNDVICSIGEILDQPVETDNEEIDARKLLWDKKKKCWLHSHSIINNNMQKEEQKLFGGGTVNCLECSALHTIYNIPDYCINKEYLNINECNEISYYLMKGTYEMIRKKDPKYDKQYSYGNTWEAEFIGALIFEIRIHIWWHIGLKRCKYQITSKGAPYISIDMCCQLLIEKRNELQKQFNNIRLYMDNICDHLWYLICIKKTEQNNVYLRKKIAN
eukprot:524396_1